MPLFSRCFASQHLIIAKLNVSNLRRALVLNVVLCDHNPQTKNISFFSAKSVVRVKKKKRKSGIALEFNLFFFAVFFFCFFFFFLSTEKRGTACGLHTPKWPF